MKYCLIILSLMCLAIQADAQCGAKCGTQRWAVKTLTDKKVRRVKFSPLKRRSIAWLRSREEPPEDAKSARRIIGIETLTFKIRGVLIADVRESDRDYRIVLADENDPSQTVAAEFPNPTCRNVCRSRYLGRMKKARAAYDRSIGRPPTQYREFKKRIIVETTGVGFWDFKYAAQQRGSAPNNVEIHPVLSFRILRVKRIRSRHG
jgi:hypothetical protein